MRIVPSIRSLLFALAIVVVSAASFPQVGISISFGPPALPVYEQPYCPAEGYLWTPGYWAYHYDGFFFNEGYWGPHVGFYGGIPYGFGYFGEGYEGGRWDNGRFFYNRSVNNVNVTNIHNVYNTTVITNTTVNRVSYNGGTGGINARPRPEDEIAAREKHVPPVAVQTQHVQAARANPQLRASVNQGKPPVAATPKPGAFNDRAIVPTKEARAPYHPLASRAAAPPVANAPAPRPEKSVPVAS